MTARTGSILSFLRDPRQPAQGAFAYQTTIRRLAADDLAPGHTLGVVIRHHRTDIVRASFALGEDGCAGSYAAVLDDGGWGSATTRDRMSDALDQIAGAAGVKAPRFTLKRRASITVKGVPLEDAPAIFVDGVAVTGRDAVAVIGDGDFLGVRILEGYGAEKTPLRALRAPPPQARAA